MKIGIDVHGTADAFPAFFVELSKMFIANGHEVHIVTGRRRSEIEPQVKALGVVFTHFFSITDFQESVKKTEIVYGPTHNPWMDEKVWRRSKGEYAKRVGLDMMFENQPEYAEHFYTPVALMINGEIPHA